MTAPHLTPPRPDQLRPRPRAVPWLIGGLVATLITGIAVLVDRAMIGSIDELLDDTYRDHPDARDDSTTGLIVGYLVTVAGLGVIGWLAVLRGVTRRKAWALPVGVALWAIGVTVALTNLMVTEYGGHLVPVWLGLLGLVPSILGVMALLAMWKRRGV